MLELTTYYYLAAKHSGKFLTVSENGGQIVQNEIHLPKNQIWLFIPANNIECYYIINKGTGECLAETGDQIALSKISGGDPQIWKVKHLDNGLFLIQNKEDQCLCVDGKKTGNGASIMLWRYHRGEHQHWNLLKPA